MKEMLRKNIAVNDRVEYGCYGNFIPATPIKAERLINGYIRVTLKCEDGFECTEAVSPYEIDMTTFENNA